MCNAGNHCRAPLRKDASVPQGRHDGRGDERDTQKIDKIIHRLEHSLSVGSRTYRIEIVLKRRPVLVPATTRAGRGGEVGADGS